MSSPHEYTFRLAKPTDGPALDRLAELEQRDPLKGALLVAESDGAVVAAVGVTSGDVLADPFLPTSEAVSLLRLRARQMVPDPRRHEGRSRRWRLATRVA